MGNKKKSDQLGLNYSTASSRLKKKILFNLLVRLKENYCFQCSSEIESVDELSIEHKIPWLDNSVDLFWDLDNIAFSHISCNSGAARNYNKGRSKHPSIKAYNSRGCRCDECKKIASKYRRKKYLVTGK